MYAVSNRVDKSKEEKKKENSKEKAQDVYIFSNSSVGETVRAEYSLIGLLIKSIFRSV